jgi:hypothetical protein
MNNNEILAGLSKSADILVNSMKQKLSSGYPKAIEQSIVTKTPQTTTDGAFIDIELGGDKAKMAAAFEWGSGLRAERGAKTRYPINPKNASVLAFPWDIGSNLNPSVIGTGKVTATIGKKVFLPGVMHPGIAPRPYIRPSIDETKNEIRKVLGQSFKTALLIGTQKVTVIEVK